MAKCSPTTRWKPSATAIVAIVPPEGVAAVSAKETVACRAHVLMPGLVNLHRHAAMTSASAASADDLALMDWLQNHIWPAEGKHVSDEFVYDGTLIGTAEMIRSGTTTVNRYILQFGGGRDMPARRHADSRLYTTA